MAYINLLPWREQEKETQKKIFLIILASIAVFTLLLTFLIGLFYQLKIDGQNTRNQFLQNEITILDVKIAEIRTLNTTKKELIKRISAVEQLQRNRNVGTQVFSEITSVVPSGVYLTSAFKTGNVLSFEGKSVSNSNLSNMIRNIENSELLYDAKLHKITSSNIQKSLLSDFNMVVKVKSAAFEERLDKVSAKAGQ